MKQERDIAGTLTDGVVHTVESAVSATDSLVSKTEAYVDVQVERNRRVLRRHPFLFGFLGTFGIVAVGTGFQDLVHTVPVLRENPLYILAFGTVLLFATGALYRRLQNG